MRTKIRQVLLLGAALLSVLVACSLSACSSGSNDEKQAGGYYEGPMQPKGGDSLGQSDSGK